MPDVTVETWLVPAGRWHIRLHEVTTPRRLEAVEGGFAIAKPDFGAWDEERRRRTSRRQDGGGRQRHRRL